MLLQEHLRNGGRSNADLSSPSFVSTAISQTQNEEGGSSASQSKRRVSIPNSPHDFEATSAALNQKYFLWIERNC